MKKIFSVLISLVMIISLFACGKKSEVSDASGDSGKKTYIVGVLQLVQHPALDNCYKGLRDYLDENKVSVFVDYQNASGEQSACQTIAEKFSNDNIDLCYAIATPAAEAAMAILECPVVGSAITDPAASGLCKSNNNTGNNFTAASDLTPVDAQFDLLAELIPDAKKIGILYCSAESNSKIQSDMAIKAAKAHGMEAKEYTVVSSADIQTVVESMIGNVDCIYIPTDNVISAGFDTVATIANENKIPTIVGEEAMVDKGGYATYGIDYYKLGRLAGEITEKILVGGKKPSEIPVSYLDADSCTRKINSKTAEILGLPKE